MSLHTIGIGIGHTVLHIQIRSTQIDRGRWRALAMEMEVEADGTAGPSQLGYYKHQTASPTASVTRARMRIPSINIKL